MALIGRKGICTECVKEGDYEIKWLTKPSKGLCALHNNKRLNTGKYTSLVKKVSEKRKITKTEDYELFKSIWESRPHFSEVSGKPLNYSFSPAMFFCFSHVLTKNAYPSYRHNRYNIVLVTQEEHTEWEFGERSNPKWEFKKKIAEHLKINYYKNKA